MTTTDIPATIDLRWMIRADLDRVCQIDRRSFDEPWTPSTFRRHLRTLSCIGMVAEVREIVVGYMVYYVAPNVLEVARLAVDPQWRHLNVGTSLCRKLDKKLSPNRRNRWQMLLDERNLGGQLFLQKMGCRASVVDDGYLFVRLHEDL